MSNPSKPEISFLFSFHNAATTVESCLTPILSLEGVAAEIIIINDGSTDDTGEIISSLLDYHNHDHAFYFSYDEKRGQGMSLNEALKESTTPTFVIMDSTVEIQEQALISALEQLEKGTAVAAIPESEVSTNREVLKRMFSSHKTPSSANYIFVKNRIKPEILFLNPFISNGHACELLLRCGKTAPILETERFFVQAESNYFTEISSSECDTILYLTGLLKFEKPEVQREIPSSENLTDSEIHKTWKRIEFLRLEGHYAEALDLCNLILASDPNHHQAEDTKIFMLERLNRYVEASELKFIRKRKKMQLPSDQPVKKGEILISRPAKEPEPIIPEKENPKENVPAHEVVESFKHTVIVPVTGSAMTFIEPCLIALDTHCNPAETELIVVDNACLDDTFSYLDQLRERNFFNIRLIKNIRNAGFSRSVNQGVEKAKGDIIVVMHADVIMESDVPTQLAAILASNPEIGLIGPVTDNTMNPDQARVPSDQTNDIESTTYLDSFLFAFRKSDQLNMDTRYQQAWFDDVDLCWQVRESGKHIFVATGVQVRHYFGAFTEYMGLSYDSDAYQSNLDTFNKKWDLPAPTVDSASGDHIEELIQLGRIVNVLYPHESVKSRAITLFTDELKTTILGATFSQDELTALTRIMMVMEQRDVMRQLEERLEAPLDDALRSELIQFYYSLHVFSRCQKYLEFKTGKEPLAHRLYRLRIAWREKNLEDTAMLLKELMEMAPGHPEVYKIAGELHEFQGNKDDADGMFTLADQLDPFRFPWPPPVKSESGGFQESEQTS